VYVVSPTTLYAHLQTILLSFEGKKIESKSRDLFKMLRALQVDFHKVEDNMVVLGKHINNTSSQFNNVNTGFAQIGQKINSTKSLDE
jgi:DNA recombination protein RmuC